MLLNAAHELGTGRALRPADDHSGCRDGRGLVRSPEPAPFAASDEILEHLLCENLENFERYKEDTWEPLRPCCLSS